MMDCAAFSLEATENGEKSERISAKLDLLAKDLAGTTVAAGVSNVISDQNRGRSAAPSSLP